MQFLTGYLTFSINGESTSGVALVNPVVTTTDNSKVYFDGDAPVIEYIDKDNIANDN